MNQNEDGPEVSDWEILATVAQGDTEAFAVLVDRHQDRLIRVCERYLGNRDKALDAAQDVLLKLYRNAARYRPRGQLFTLIYRMAVNHCLNRLRRKKILSFLPFAKGVGDNPTELDPPDPSAGPEETLEARRSWEATRKAINGLPLNQRSVVVLVKLEGLSYRRTAEVLGITEGAVESRLFRAMRNLDRAQEKGRPRVTGEGRLA